MFESKLDLRTGSGITREFFRQIEPYDSANQEIESQAFSSLANLAHLDVLTRKISHIFAHRKLTLEAEVELQAKS